MTTVFVTCGAKECDPKLIEYVIDKRNLPFSEGQTTLWTCKHVTTFKRTFESKYEVLT